LAYKAFISSFIVYIKELFAAALIPMFGLTVMEAYALLILFGQRISCNGSICPSNPCVQQSSKRKKE
jgi:hypothetical protein